MEKVRLPPLDTYKIIRDPIHGYIPLTRLEFDILQTPIFNRLHDLKQTSMAYLVFPGAVTTRFQHSLGVMDVASKLVYRVLGSLTQDTFLKLFPAWNRESRRSDLIQTVRLAAMLHDLGHGPFSHALEEVMGATLRQKHKAEFEQAMRLCNARDPSSLPVHEYYSFRLIEKGEIAELVGQGGSRRSISTIHVHPHDVSSLIAKGAVPRPGIFTETGLSILRKVISSQLDADRMDYLARDAYMTGVPYGIIDVERVVMNISVREDERGKHEVSIHERALGSVEDMLDARFKMYKWLYSHHMVVATNELLKQAVTSLIEEGYIDQDTFYWRRFEAGAVTDTTVMSEVMRRAGSNGLCKGLTDRRFLPVSLLKRPGDHRAFEIEIMEFLGRETGIDAIQDKLVKFFHSMRNESFVKVGKVETRALTVPVPRSPYKAISKDDTIWICSDEARKLTELTKTSDYFAAINAEWTRFPSYFISYIVPGKSKTAASKMRERFRKTLIEAIAAF